MTQLKIPTKNIGEWSEYYAFLKIISAGQLNIADEDLMPQAGREVIFKSLHRTNSDGSTVRYLIGETDVELKDALGATHFAISKAKLTKEAGRLFLAMKANSRKTPIELSDFPLRENLQCVSISQGSQTKIDLSADVYDPVTGQANLMGFSIKSRIGSPPTYLNTSKLSTKFKYRVSGIDTALALSVNKIFETEKNGEIKQNSKGQNSIATKERVRALYQMGARLEFHSMYKKTFEDNLRMVDTLMPEFIAEGLVQFFRGEVTTFKDFAAFLETASKFKKYKMNTDAYRYKLQRLISASNLGMVASKPWDGTSEAAGGYIIVKKDGSVLCYPTVEQDNYRKHLFKMTKFDTPSGNRHEYAHAYVDDGQVFFDLQPQFREK